MREKRSIVIVQGGQFGSEAKGAVAHFLCQKLGIQWAARTGSINAGHTIKFGNPDQVGDPLPSSIIRQVYQQLPTGAVLPNMNVVIGPGAYIHHDTIIREADMAKCRDRLFIDRMCGIHLDLYTDEAAEARRNLRIGATGKGCAEAIVHKIKDRGNGVPLLYSYRHQNHPGFLADTAEMLTDSYHQGDGILIEGTQGTLLDLHTGPYPFTTSRQTLASSWVSECGLSPALNYEVVLVARTYPIRVAGQSGPMHREISWPSLARRMNKRLDEFGLPPVVSEEALKEFEKVSEAVMEDNRTKGVSASESKLTSATTTMSLLPGDVRTELSKLFEMTTVTKRLRRIGEMDLHSLKMVVKKEAPAYVVLTFLNYVFPELVWQRIIHQNAAEYVRRVQNTIGCRIKYVSIGPMDTDILDVSEQIGG